MGLPYNKFSNICLLVVFLNFKSKKKKLSKTGLMLFINSELCCACFQKQILAKHEITFFCWLSLCSGQGIVIPRRRKVYLQGVHQANCKSQRLANRSCMKKFREKCGFQTFDDKLCSSISSTYSIANSLWQWSTLTARTQINSTDIKCQNS